MTQTSQLHEQRLDRACSILVQSGASQALDLGCGSGALLERLVAAGQFTHILGLEASGVSLAQARERLAPWLALADTPLVLKRGSLQQRDEQATGFDAAAMIEVIEHIPPNELSRVELTVFGQFRPRMLFLTTPNAEYNPLFGLGHGEFREPDHCFEWDRSKFRKWTTGVARRHGYRVRIGGIGEIDQEFGPPTQTAWFTRLD